MNTNVETFLETSLHIFHILLTIKKEIIINTVC